MEVLTSEEIATRQKDDEQFILFKTFSCYKEDSSSLRGARNKALFVLSLVPAKEALDLL